MLVELMGMGARMTPPRELPASARWVWAALRAGLITSVHVPVGIAIVKLVPTLWAGYPMLVLPLLLTGPLAAGRLGFRDAWRAAALAGIVSGLVTACSLATALYAFGDWWWGMTSAAGAPPMPPIPRIMVLPTEYLTWAQQDILFFEPLVATTLGLLAWAIRAWSAKLHLNVGALLPTSLGSRLRLAFMTLTVFGLAGGMVGFGMIEDMHLRTHRVQLRADWQRQLGSARDILDDELHERLTGTAEPDLEAASARAERVERIYQVLRSTAPRPGLSVGRDDLVAVFNEYQPLLAAAEVAIHAYHASISNAAVDPTLQPDVAPLVDAITSLGKAQHRVDADLTELLAGSDLTHHQRLIALMGLVGLVAGLGLWTGERTLEAIGAPLAVLAAHMRRVARGDFARRVPDRGPEELRQLGESVNQMTADLARLYAVEREHRSTAEAIATRERELTSTKELWANTLVHDLKNPLALIVGWAEVLEHCQASSAAAERQEALEQLRHSTKMLEDLVEDVNDSFRLESGALPIHRTVARPGELLWTALTEYHGLERGVPDVRVASGLAPVVADTRLVGRVLHNLIGNAYKHGGPAARVVLTAERGDGVVRFVVDDDGPGIPGGERDRVFDRFIQGPSATRGSGLGLAFCKLVIHQLGGRIWADSAPLGGARIAFELPQAPAELPARRDPMESPDDTARLESRVA
ncbi:MAG: ATP-binding protein [Chloroflexota bacterium]